MVPGTHSTLTSTGWRGWPVVAAGLLYAAVLSALFFELYRGYVLYPGAAMHRHVPFKMRRADYVAYLNGIQGDVWRYVVPSERMIHESVRAGRLPQWNPHIYCGFPFHANGQSATFSLFRLPYWLLDPVSARGPLAALRMCCSAMAVFLLMRRAGLSWLSCFLAGLSWMLCAFNVRWLQWQLSDITLWLPVLLLFSERLIERASAGRFLACVLAMGVLQLAGHPELQLQATLAAILYSLVRTASRGSTLLEAASTLALVAAAFLLGLALAAVALVPFLFMLFDSVDWHRAIHRAEPLPLAASRILIAPDSYGRPCAGYFYLGPANYTEAACWFGTVPLLLATSYLTTRSGRWLVRTTRRSAGKGASESGECASSPPSGVDLRPQRPGQRHVSLQVADALFWFAALAWLGSVPFVFDVGWLSDFFTGLPLLRQCNGLRMSFGIQLGGAILAGFGLERLRAERGRAELFWASGLAVAVAAASCYLVTQTWNLSMPGVPSGLQMLSRAEFWQHPLVRTCGGTVVAIGSAGWLICFAFRSARAGLLSRPALQCPGATAGLDSGRDGSGFSLASEPGRRLALGLSVLAATELLWFAWGYNPIGPRALVDPALPAQMSFLRTGKCRFIATGEILSPNVAMSFGLLDLRGYDYPLPRRLAHLLDRLGLRYPMTIVPHDRVLPLESALAVFFERACVRYLITDRSDLLRAMQKSIGRSADSPGAGVARRVASAAATPARPSSRWSLLWQDGQGTVIWENRGAYPRAWLAPAWRPVRSEQALEHLLDPAVDLRRLSVVEQSTGGMRRVPALTPRWQPDGQAANHNSAQASSAMRTGGAVGGNSLAGRENADHVAIRIDEPERVVIEVEIGRAGLLVLADRFDHGWSVSVDGSPAVPLRANYLFRGVFVPAGKHTVVWSYRTPGLVLGAAISLCSALTLLAIGVSALVMACRRGHAKLSR